MQHHFDVELAKEYGILEAILLDNFCFWTSKNVANGVHIHDGHVWTYNSVKAFAEMMPYASPKQIRSALSHLETDGLIITGNFNKSHYDRTKWYSLTDKALSICHYENFHLPSGENGSTAKGGPIPDNYTYTDTDFYTDTTPLTPQGELFGRFWAAYPKKVGKANCERWFARHKVNEETLQAMLESLAYLKTTEQWQKDGGQYIPNPQTWLNGRRWEDESAKPPQREKVTYIGKL